MSVVKTRARELISSLSDEDVAVLIKIAERLAEWEATQELLEDEGMVASIRRGLEELEQGDTVSLEQLRKSASS
ncbi:hypothetical protein LR021_03140 [Candidatus Bipolaricaulota bacterium]|nr:hypothetical protein [Candidatus Bipolaricaulota bacterium]